jgi:prepilin peptidase CpaA
MGGGDVKLLAALGLWLPLTKMLILLEWMALGGGLLTLGMLMAHRLRKAPGKPEIPYGVAIVGAGLLVVANDILTKSIA